LRQQNPSIARAVSDKPNMRRQFATNAQIAKCSIFLPVCFIAAISHFGFKPRPLQVSDLLAGVRNFGSNLPPATADRRLPFRPLPFRPLKALSTSAGDSRYFFITTRSCFSPGFSAVLMASALACSSLIFRSMTFNDAVRAIDFPYSVLVPAVYGRL